MHVRYILHLHLRWNRKNKNNVLPRWKTYNHVVIRYRFSYVPKNTEPFVVFTEFFQKVVIFFKVAKFQRAYYFLKSTHYIIFSERNYWIPLLLNWYNECIISTIELAYCPINNIGHWCILWCSIRSTHGNKNCKEGVSKFDISDTCKT